MSLEGRKKRRVKSRISPKGDKVRPQGGLDPRTVVPLVNGAGTALTLAADDHVFRQGDPADAVFYVEAGKIQIVVVSDQGASPVCSCCSPTSTMTGAQADRAEG